MPATIEQAFPSNLYGGRLTIDLDAIVSNWSLLKGKVSDSTDCAAVLKADAYGTGQDKTAAALYQAGCRTFFVAVPTEDPEIEEIGYITCTHRQGEGIAHECTTALLAHLLDFIHLTPAHDSAADFNFLPKEVLQRPISR